MLILLHCTVVVFFAVGRSPSLHLLPCSFAFVSLLALAELTSPTPSIEQAGFLRGGPANVPNQRCEERLPPTGVIVVAASAAAVQKKVCLFFNSILLSPLLFVNWDDNLWLDWR